MPAAGGAPAFADITFVGPRFGLARPGVRRPSRVGPARNPRNHAEAHRSGAGAWPPRRRRPPGVDGRRRQPRDAARPRHRCGGDASHARFRSRRPSRDSRPGALVSGEFTGSWRGWHSATLDGTARHDVAPAPGRLEAPERYAATGRVLTRFARGSWTIDMDTRVDDGLDVTGRWTLRASAADFARWPMNGSLALDGATPAHPARPGCGCSTSIRRSTWHRPSATSAARSTLTGTLGTPEATVDVAGSLAWPDQPDIESRAQAVITADTVRLTAFEAISGPARATSTLAIDLNRDTIDGQFEATSVPVESWLRRFELSAPVTGTVDATGRLSGPLVAHRHRRRRHGRSGRRDRPVIRSRDRPRAVRRPRGPWHRRHARPWRGHCHRRPYMDAPGRWPRRARSR